MIIVHKEIPLTHLLFLTLKVILIWEHSMLEQKIYHETTHLYRDNYHLNLPLFFGIANAISSLFIKGRFLPLPSVEIAFKRQKREEKVSNFIHIITSSPFSLELDLGWEN